MAERRFDIIFNGSITEGHTVATVKENIKQLFKLDDQAAEHLFSGKQVVIKKNLDRQTASRYQAAILKAGAKIQLVMHQSQPTNGANTPSQATPDKTDNAISSHPVKNKKQPDSDDGLQALPNTGDLLREEEKTAFVAAEIPTDHISAEAPAEQNNPFTAQTGDNLTQEYTPRYPGFDHIQLNTALTLAEAGNDLLNDDEKKVFQEADVDISRLSIVED